MPHYRAKGQPDVVKLTATVYVSESDVKTVRCELRQWFLDSEVSLYHPAAWLQHARLLPAEQTPAVDEFFQTDETGFCTRCGRNLEGTLWDGECVACEPESGDGSITGR